VDIKLLIITGERTRRDSIRNTISREFGHKADDLAQ
jgi:hypothetical protein